MLTKEQIIDSMKQLPDTFSLEDVIERILLLEKIENGIQQSNEGKVIPDSELDNYLPGWLV